MFSAPSFSTLSQCCHAVVALLYPFVWQHTYIPVLPSAMLDIVCTPTPFIVGLLSSSLPQLTELPLEEVRGVIEVSLQSYRNILLMSCCTLLCREITFFFYVYRFWLWILGIIDFSDRSDIFKGVCVCLWFVTLCICVDEIVSASPRLSQKKRVVAKVFLFFYFSKKALNVYCFSNGQCVCDFL